MKALQKLSGYLVPTPRAVFVQDDLPVLLKLIRSVHMHIGLGTIKTNRFADKAIAYLLNCESEKLPKEIMVAFE